MYVARFSYDLLPSNRQQGIDFVRKEVETAFSNGLNARLLVPLTRGQSGGPALQFEVELTSLDQLDQFRSRGAGSAEDTKSWMHAFSEILTAPPSVEILRVDETKPGPRSETRRPGGAENRRCGCARRAASAVCLEHIARVRRCGAMQEMRVGPSMPAVRCRPQTAASCSRQPTVVSVAGKPERDRQI